VSATPGRLDVVATPIGNLGDLSARARSALEQATVIAAEDTRHTGQLLASCGISRPMLSLHDYNEAQRSASLVQRMLAGEVIALVSDAGTPLLSDPGYQLVRAAAAAGVVVRTIPGPSAVTAALSIAGLATDRFVFEGFLPASTGARRKALSLLATEHRTLIFFEAPHRLVETLADMAAVFGNERAAVIARELTKTYESVYRGTLAALVTMAGADPQMARGEIVLLVAGAEQREVAGDTGLLARALPLLLGELPPARAAGIAAKLSGVSRDEAYALAVQLQRQSR
jgi:16S rRNA (cytidine1402-2'-O)-methyltransferase